VKSATFLSGLGVAGVEARAEAGVVPLLVPLAVDWRNNNRPRTVTISPCWLRMFSWIPEARRSMSAAQAVFPGFVGGRGGVGDARSGVVGFGDTMATEVGIGAGDGIAAEVGSPIDGPGGIGIIPEADGTAGFAFPGLVALALGNPADGLGGNGTAGFVFPGLVALPVGNPTDGPGAGRIIADPDGMAGFVFPGLLVPLEGGGLATMGAGRGAPGPGRSA
jgi:hypothetical protein